MGMTGFRCVNSVRAEFVKYDDTEPLDCLFKAIESKITGTMHYGSLLMLILLLSGVSGWVAPQGWTET
ncbi:hypothetical protein M501DRAFT_1002014 [Patellaria atrata CBS 101060]|uniref:Uncharacterized protein n=1 Tax=Patellaria atrata CBS 101060 TaxID=1346257 RepID=A0A9P4SE77_9PEZI|nr:hypothetical protein M501DRAFT_1002014 [Patellaria atrata CBS 101060]